jgi:glycosyltransferase involved in cell wall biosynthesis
LKYPLAILVPQLGVVTESFITKHIKHLLPKGTVVIADSSQREERLATLKDDNYLVREDLVSPMSRRLINGVFRRMGIKHDNYHESFAKAFLKRKGVQVIMGEYLHASLPWIDLSKEMGIRFVGHAHGYDISRILKDHEWVEKYRKYNETQGVITVSQISKSRLIDIGILPEKVFVIPYGVDVRPSPLTRLNKEIVMCLSVGRMVSKKAPIFLLDAYRRALEVFPRMHLNYIGDGELLSAAKQYVDALGISDKVTLYGSLENSEVLKMMSNADIYIQHSVLCPDTGDEEGLPVSILEAMAASMPVVSTRHAGIPEAVRDNDTGFLVEERDVANFAKRVVELANDHAKRQKMGENGWHRAKNYFSWEKERQELLDVLGLA